jgi:hypothetical protein
MYAHFKYDLVVFKVSGPTLVAYIEGIPICGMWLGVDPRMDIKAIVCLEEIGLRAQNL